MKYPIEFVELKDVLYETRGNVTIWLDTTRDGADCLTVKECGRIIIALGERLTEKRSWGMQTFDRVMYDGYIGYILQCDIKNLKKIDL